MAKLSAETLEQKQARELKFWQRHDEETIQALEPRNLAHKMPEARVFHDCFDRYRANFTGDRILELGAGQAWASVLVKRYVPEAEVIATDISERALQAVHAWEHVFGAEIDRKYACKCYEIQEPDNSLDLVFAFASAHHFAAHRRTLMDVARVLRPGGQCLYLYEPACPRFWYPMAYRRVNRKRPEVPEDVLIYPKLRDLAHEAGLEAKVDFYPSTTTRGPKETIYYLMLASVKFLQPALPCTANFVFLKPL